MRRFLAAIVLTVSLQAAGPARAEVEDDTRVVHGRIEVDLAAIVDGGVRARIARHLRHTLPLFDQIYGPPPRRLFVGLTEDKSLGSAFRASTQTCEAGALRGSISAGEPDDVTFYIRALAGLYWTCDRAQDRRFDDGMAEAANQTVLQVVRVRSPWRMERVQYMVANRPGIGAGRHYGADTAATLLSVRFELLATAFRIFEEDHPGFMRRFNALLTQKVSAGQTDDLDHMALAADVEPSFSDWAKSQRLFDERPRGDQLMMVAQGDWVRLLAVKRDEFGKETMWPHLQLTVRVDPLGKDIELATDEKGMATFELTEVSSVRPGRMVTLHAHGEGLSDELTFTPVPPQTNVAGAPHPWDIGIWGLAGGTVVWAWWSDRRGRRRGRNRPARNISSHAKPFVRAAASLGAAALCCSVGYGSLSRAAARFDNARWVLRNGSQSAADVRAAEPGSRALVAGRIDPRLQPVDRARGFALYFGEFYSTDDTWEWDYTIAPPFTLNVDDGPVEVVNGCRDANSGWTIARPSYNNDCYPLRDLSTTEYNGNGNDRFRGLKPGDPVVVFGVSERGGIVARAVSGGSLKGYAADVRRDAWGRALIGAVWLVVALAVLLRLPFSIRRGLPAVRGRRTT